MKYLLLGFLFLSVSALAQVEAPPLYNNAIQVGFVQKTLKASTEGADDEVDFNPHTPTGLAIGYSNRAAGLSLTVNLGSSEETETQVKTTSQDYQLRYFKGNFGAEAIYQNYQGFAISPRSLVVGDEYLKPDLKMRMYQLQFDWAFKGLSALESFAANWEKPSTDGAAYYISGSLSQSEISNPTPFFPQGNGSYGRDVDLTDGNYQTLQVGAGASYLWQWERFYIAVYGSILAGPQIQKYKTTTVDSDDFKWVLSPQGKIAAVYDWGSSYVSFIGHINRVTTDLQDTKLNFYSQEVAVSYGRRF